MKKKKILLLFIILLFFLFNTASFGASTEINSYSPYSLIMEMSTGTVIYEKNGYTVVPPASTTKIMTAILTLENCKLTDTAVVSSNAIDSVPYSYTTGYLEEGEILTIDDLLNVLLIASANDAANVLAEHIAGSVDNFSNMMNKKAIEIGCKSTHFVNPNGVSNENHYSTAYDLALMGKYAMQNETFRKIVTTTSYTLPATNVYPEANRFFHNTNIMLYPNDSPDASNYYYKYATGIKTGYTDAAGDCIVASAKKDDYEYIVVILGGDKTEDGLSQRYLDCKNLFNYAFDNYAFTSINKAGSTFKEVEIENAALYCKKLNLVVKDDITALMNQNIDTSTLVPEVDFSSQLVAPIFKDTVIGKITYTIDGNTYSSELLAGNNIHKFDIVDIILFIVLVLIVLLIIRIPFIIRNKIKRR